MFSFGLKLLGIVHVIIISSCKKKCSIVIKYFMYCRNMEKYHIKHGYRLLEWHLFPWKMLKLSRKLPQVQFLDLFLKLFGQNPMEKR